MMVQLINPTPSEVMVNTLLFTKHTRLELTPMLMDEIAAWPPERKEAELAYMAKTIPSSWEFAEFIFLVSGVSRAYTHQQVRTRAASYAQQTMRVLDMSKGFGYVVGPSIQAEPDLLLCYQEAMKVAQHAYSYLINKGAEIEDARGVLPTNIQTNIVCKFNLRTLSEMCRSRTGKRTQGEYREVVRLMKAVTLEHYPWALPFLEPQGMQAITDLEGMIDNQFLTKEDRTAAYKCLDILRKLI